MSVVAMMALWLALFLAELSPWKAIAVWLVTVICDVLAHAGYTYLKGGKRP